MGFLVASFGEIDDPTWKALSAAPPHAGPPPPTPAEWTDPAELIRIAWLDGRGRSRRARVTDETRTPDPETHGPCFSAGPDLVGATSGRIESDGNTVAAVLRAYRADGVKGLAALRGDYAFVLWDRRRRKLLLGCDAVGLRALAFRWDGRCLVASTRAVSLLQDPRAQRRWDPTYLAHALGGLWCFTATATPFQGIGRMAGGQILEISARGLERLRGSRFAFPPAGRFAREGALHALGEQVDRIVLEGFDGERACIALSGGVDSATLAAAIASRHRVFAAISLVAPAGSPGDAAALSSLIAAFPGIAHRAVGVSSSPEGLLDTAGILDEPVCAGPVLQPERVSLLRAARDQGFDCVFDGEGGDEIFDIAWRPGDLIRQRALHQVAASFFSGVPRSLVLRDYVASLPGMFSRRFLQHQRDLLRAAAPWMRASFWASPAFLAAWGDAVTLMRKRTVSDRLPEVLGGAARHWRAQDVSRSAIGIDGRSPWLDQRVVELVGSLRPQVATDVRRPKALVRHLAARRLPASVAWRRKTEPMSDWLAYRWISQPENVARLIQRLGASPVLTELIEPDIVLDVAGRARGAGVGSGLASSIVQLGATAEWVASVERAYAIS